MKGCPPYLRITGRPHHSLYARLAASQQRQMGAVGLYTRARTDRDRGGWPNGQNAPRDPCRWRRHRQSRTALILCRCGKARGAAALMELRAVPSRRHGVDRRRADSRQPSAQCQAGRVRCAGLLAPTRVYSITWRERCLGSRLAVASISQLQTASWAGGDEAITWRRNLPGGRCRLDGPPGPA